MTFNTQSLSAFPPFQGLPPKIRELLYQLVEEGRFNDHGGLKRPPNVWLLFRSDVCASSDDKNVNQSELTAKCKVAWEQATDEQRSQLKQRAEAKNAELLKLFPDYQYRPMSSEEKDKWSRMSSAMRKNFWLAAAVRIVERIANPHGEWEGLLSLNRWAQTLGNSEQHLDTSALKETTDATVGAPVDASSDGPGFYGAPQAQSTGPAMCGAGTIKKPTTRDCGTGSSQSRGASLPTHRFHPYQCARNHPFELQASAQTPAHRRSARLNPPPKWLKSFLVPLGDPGDGKKRRRLVLCKFQERKRTIWVEEEVDDDVPKRLFDMLSQGGPAGTSTRDLIVRNYSNPLMPQALDEDQNPYVPAISSISEYRQYIVMYKASLASGIPFIWAGKSTLTPNASPSSNTNHVACSPTTPKLAMGDGPAPRLSVITPDQAPPSAPVALDDTFTDEQFESIMAELDSAIVASGQPATEAPQLFSQDQMYVTNQANGVDGGLLGITDSHQLPAPMASANVPPQPFDLSAQETRSVCQQVGVVEEDPDSASFQAGWNMWVDPMAVA